MLKTIDGQKRRAAGEIKISVPLSKEDHARLMAVFERSGLDLSQRQMGTFAVRWFLDHVPEDATLDLTSSGRTKRRGKT